jgi:hypothetical protein
MSTVLVCALASGCTGSANGQAISESPTTTHVPPSPGATPSVAPSTSHPALAWTPIGLPAGFADRVRHLPGVRAALPVVGGTVWLTGSRSAAGAVVDAPPSGMAIPLDLAGASPGGLGSFLPSDDHRFLRELARGKAILGQTSARLRHLGPGGVLEFGGHRIAVAGVVPDADIGAHELLVSTREAAALGVTRQLYLQVLPATGASWPALARRIDALVPNGVPLRLRAPGRAMYLRQADAVLPPVIMKAVFGEFAGNPKSVGAGGWFTIDPSWVRAHIETAHVPILGSVTCNRVLVPLVRGALRELARRGLSSLVRVGEFAGCYAPRMIPGSPGRSISHHAWGAALDINAGANPFGGTPHQDPRLVAVFRHWGLTWGGRWLVPDGMHFEFLCSPLALRSTPGPACAG